MTLDCTCNRLTDAERKAALWDGIVRCRECKHGFCWVYDTFMCELWAYYEEGSPKLFPRVMSDGYCAWGERREDE